MKNCQLLSNVCISAAFALCSDQYFERNGENSTTNRIVYYQEPDKIPAEGEFDANYPNTFFDDIGVNDARLFQFDPNLNSDGEPRDENERKRIKDEEERLYGKTYRRRKRSSEKEEEKSEGTKKKKKERDILAKLEEMKRENDGRASDFSF